MVNWTANADVRNHMLNAAEDCLLDAARKKGFALPLSVLDKIGKELLPIAEAHYHDTTRRQRFAKHNTEAGPSSSGSNAAR